MRHLALILGFLVSLAACAEGDAQSSMLEKFQEGVHYQKLSKPVNTISVDKVEITEVFRFGCPACYRFEQSYLKWKPTKPDYIDFIKNPVVWNGDTETRAQVYFTAEKFGIADEIALVIFQKLHDQGDKKAMLKEDSIAAEFAKLGVEKEKFVKMYNNWLIKSKVRQSDERTRAFAVTGTPEVFVDGRYRVTVGLTGSYDAMLEVATFLAEKAAAEKGIK